MLNYLINLFFPKICAGCNSFLETNEIIICTNCRHEMPLTQLHLNPKNEAFMKFYGKVQIEHASAFLAFHKKGIAQKMIHNLKYKGNQEIGTLLGEWYGEDLKELSVANSFDIIVPVPLHPKKMKERGYNQVTAFGLALSKKLNISFNDTILQKNIYTQSQSRKSFLDRSENIENLFNVSFSDENHNKHFLLIDDVITTGATLEACSRALLKIPGAKVSIVCIAMAQN